MTSKFKGVFAEGGFPALGRVIVRHPWLVIVAWLALALILFLTIPPLPVVALKKPPPFLPSDSPVLVSTSQMKDAFHEPSSGNLAVVILSNEKGLTPADEGVYRTLVDKLRSDTDHVLTTQDFVHIPELRQAMTSKDNKAWQFRSASSARWAPERDSGRIETSSRTSRRRPPTRRSLPT